ncbi:hypothetical protein BDM02DRAFT_3112143 [Thelephora ganbajun]|uniref:Uncharacterized protein n=1 Tax=Thelephora ganbajun TaxID=370292 RepID=A0ACB6ZLA9_THEGA|nr:hypothetical protein BDM02DRAFT_3112143 [Thelephora ganbajun]
MAAPGTSVYVEPSALADLDGTIGVAFIGLVLSTLFFGISNLQLYIYYVQYPKDWIVYKVSTAVLWLLDGLNLAFAIHAIYHYLIRNFGRYDQLDVVVWSFKAQILVNVILVVIIQSLYTTRLWRLNVMNYQKRWYPKLVPLSVVLGTGVGTALTVKTLQLHEFSQLNHMKWAICSAFTTSVVVDTCIAVAMICYLQGSKTVSNETNNTLTKLVIWVSSTGATTSLCSLLALIVYACMPQKLAFLAVQLLVSKLYFNSFMAFLNARNAIREKPSNVVMIGNLRSQNSPRATPTTIPNSKVLTLRFRQSVVIALTTNVFPR